MTRLPYTVPTAPEGYKHSFGYENGNLASEIIGISWEGYTYWPYDDNGNMSQLIFVAYDSQGVEVKRFSFNGYRYVSGITIDKENEKFVITTQGDSFTINWEDLLVN
ncbi:hypothetical protein ACFSO7_02575 [Bacillus sp. CGMCC 1.16607]|uniref:hypothetical protein n=1 Tax=Bacillus sp. CGMCC 1.16607 TaxID=3351842 RepID=UPI003634D468